MRGARISLAHTSLNIPSWREHMAGYFRSDLVDYLEYVFPIGSTPMVTRSLLSKIIHPAACSSVTWTSFVSKKSPKLD